MISLGRLVNFFGCWYTVPYPSFGKACRRLPLLLISAFCGNLGRSELVVLKEEKLFLLQSLEDLVPQHMGSCLAAYWWARKKKRALPRPCKKNQVHCEFSCFEVWLRQVTLSCFLLFLSAYFLCSSRLPGRTSLTKAPLATPGPFSKTPCLAFTPLYCAFKVFIHHVSISLSHGLVHNLSVYFGRAAAVPTAVLLQRKIPKM